MMVTESRSEIARLQAEGRRLTELIQSRENEVKQLRLEIGVEEVNDD